jgi:hypothetical protein
LGLFGVFAIFYQRKENNADLFVALLASCLGISLIFILYYKTAPRPLMEYMGMFYWAVPVCLTAVPIANLLNADIGGRRDRSLRAVEITKLVAFAGIVVFGIDCFVRILNVTSTPYNPRPGLTMAPEFVKLSTMIKDATRDAGEARITYAEHMMWPVVAGILLELHSEGYKACTTWRHMSFLYTDAEICKEHEAPNIRLVSSDDCISDCIGRVGAFGVDFPHNELNQREKGSFGSD